MLDRLLARAYDPVMARAERGPLGAARARLLAEVAGHVLVVGAGTGADLPHLPDAVDRLTLVEPSDAMRGRLADAVPTRLAAATEVLHGFAERLPLPDDTVDHVVLSLVLCSVRDVDAAVAELDRVLVPGGTVRVLEHGISDHAAVARLQRAVNPVWRVLSGGCNLTRDPASLLAARFEVSGLARLDVPPVSRVGPVTAGVAHR